jgi:DNA-binding IclR family transcriptional regulator
MTDAYANFVKLLKAVNLLVSSNGATIKGLSAELGISRRSVFRLLAFFDELGFPIVDEQPYHRQEKIYRLMESYVTKLPNICIPNPCLTELEIELLLSTLNFCIDKQKSEATAMLKSIRQKIINFRRI